MPQPATTMIPGAPGYDEYMAKQKQAQLISPPPPVATGGPMGQKWREGEGPGAGGAAGGGKGEEPGGAGNDFLSRFGYQGQVGINPMEQLGLGQIEGMAGQQTPMQTTQQAQDLYGRMIGGEFAPQGQQFREDVYGATKSGAMQNLADVQEQTAKSFAHRGGYFGGEHAIKQAELEARTVNPLNQLLGELNLQGFQGDVANKMGAAGGLGGLAGTQRGIESSLLGDIMGGGEMLTGRELQNRQLYQGASDRAYQDWQRARQESMAPFNMIGSLLGAQTTSPLITQSQSPWGGIAQGAGSAIAGLK